MAENCHSLRLARPLQCCVHPPHTGENEHQGEYDMTTIRNFAAHIVAAGTAFALSLALIGTTVSTPAAPQQGADFAQEISA
jgi:hypothetical protein